jgi:ADP-heptose:LPS heptosyltransferase
MPKRKRWTPVKGTANRVSDPLERLLLGGFDLTGRVLFGVARLGRQPAAATFDRSTIREVLVLRLDRIGDAIMSLPALGELRAALPKARIRLAVGRWSEAVVRHAPVDEVLVWSAPWVGRAAEGAESTSTLFARARALGRVGLDLALDLQGDVRASLLMWLARARFRGGYANTGGGWLLTHVIPLDETVSWIEQNRRAVEAVLGPPNRRMTVDPLTPADRDFGRRFYEGLGASLRRPLVGMHPAGGRPVKQWGVERWAAVAARLQREFGATVLITGSAADRPLAEALAAALPEAPIDTAGRLGVRESMAVIEGLDLFLSPDTGPMHMACAVDTPSVSVFGPSDPARYFSGGAGAPGSRHVVVRPELWCSPCNLIRKPPTECAGPAMPECLALVSVEAVHREAVRLLRAAGFAGLGRNPQ